MFARKLDWWLIGALIFLAAASLVSIASAEPSLFRAQLIWFAAAGLVIFLTIKINWRWVTTQNWFIMSLYWLIIVLLIITLFTSRSVRGAHSWLIIGPFRFQFSELAKVSLILVFASFFSRRYLEASVLKNIGVSFVYFFIPAALVAVQPSLGTAIIFFGIWFGFLAVSGLSWQRLLAGFLILILVLGILWVTFLKPFQKERILGFISPARDPLGSNYHIIQSKIAIGSAGFFGKGFRQGTQTQLGFLPASQTDFIFSSFVEEWGLFGGLLIIIAFLIIIYRIIKIGIESEGNCVKFICLGTAITLALQVFFNLGSVLGISPVVGITLPFLSYGGSSLLTNALLMGIVENIAIDSSF